MFELIKAVVEPIAKALSVSDLLARRDRKKLREVGTELFVFYTSVNEIVVAGNQIVDQIERICWWMKDKLDQGQPDAVYYSELPFWLGLQQASLLKAVQSINRLGLELQIIDRAAYAALIPLMSGKHNAIGDLIESCARDDRDDTFGTRKTALQTYDETVLQAAMAESIRFDAAQDADKLRLRHDMVAPGELTIRATRTVLEGLACIRAGRLTEFQNYLKEAQPRARLAAIEEALDKLRTALERNFSLTDVLLAVRDRRVCPTDRWIRWEDHARMARRKTERGWE